MRLCGTIGWAGRSRKISAAGRSCACWKTDGHQATASRKCAAIACHSACGSLLSKDAWLASRVAIFAVRTFDGMGRPSALWSARRMSPGHSSRSALVIIKAQHMSSPGPTPLTAISAGRARRRFSSTWGNGTQTTSPAVKDIISTIGGVRPFGERGEIADERIPRNPRQDNSITLNLVRQLIAAAQTQRGANRARDRRLRLARDTRLDHRHSM